MEKRVVLAVVLTIGVIFLSNFLFPSPEPPPGQMAADSALVEGGVAPGEFDTEDVAEQDTTGRSGVAPVVADPDPGSVVDPVGEPTGLSEPPADMKNLPFDPLEFIEHLGELPFDPASEPGLGQ